MDIEFLYFKSCPNHEKALDLLQKVMKDEGVQAPVKIIDVTSEEMAKQVRFMGSPSIRINGRDIDGFDSNLSDPLNYGRKCRIYQDGGKLSGLPPEDKIRKAVREAKHNA